MDLTNKHNLARLIDDAAADIDAEDIRRWAVWDDGGALPPYSAQHFADWLDRNLSEYEEWTVRRVLDGAVTEWCGGRTL
jgi:hypothetical protein